MKVKAPRGTNDILPDSIAMWQYIEDKLRDVFARFGYAEIRTPIFEETRLFERGIGEFTDIVEKEMYTFTDKAGRSLTLRPEGTAPVVRAYLEHKLYGRSQPVKLYYVGPMFRYERPQAGRYRQFYQYGAEALGTQDPATDAEMVAIPIELYRSIGLSEFEVQVNSIGCPRCRGRYRAHLKEMLSKRVAALCPSCQRRLERNPLRVLDCKEEKCQEQMGDVPPIIDYLCDECEEHLKRVCQYLSVLDIPYVVNSRLVRGFDYYTKTVFEIICPELGAQSAIAGGGRYDGLIEECGGPPTPAVGFAAGMERLVLALAEQGWKVPGTNGMDVYVAGIGDESRSFVVGLTLRLRRAGLSVEMDYGGRSLKAQMKAADRCNARYTVIVGEEELRQDRAVIRHMATGEQEEVPLAGLEEWLQQRLQQGSGPEKE